MPPFVQRADRKATLFSGLLSKEKLMMKKLLATLLLFSTCAQGGLPPTSTQGQSDASPQTKFNFQVPYNQKTDLGGIKALLETGNKNLLLNPSFEHTTWDTSWTTTTVTDALESTIVTDGKKSDKLTYTAQTGGVAQSVTPTIQTLGVSYEATCKVNTTMTTIQVCGLTGGSNANCNAVPASGTWQTVTTGFLGPANGTSVGVSVTTTASGTGTVYVDDCYVGPARNIGTVAQASAFGIASWPTTASCLWTVGQTSYANYSATAACTLPTGSNLQGSATAPATKVPGITFATMPPGTYKVSAVGSIFKQNANGSNAYFRFHDGTNAAVGENVITGATVGSSNIGSPVIEGTFTYTTTQSNVTIQIQTKADSASDNAIVDARSAPLTFYVYYYPSSSQAVYNSQNTPASWSGYTSGITAGCSTTSGTFADVSACTNIALTQVTNRNFGTVTTAASSLPGITATLPRIGNYLVCANPSFGVSSSSNIAMQLVDGAGTVIATSNQSPAGAIYQTQSMCGTYLATATSAITFKLQAGRGAGAGTLYVGYNNGQTMPTGTHQIDWSVVELDAPLASPYVTGQTNLVTKAITASTTATVDTQFYTCSASGGAVTLTLPLAASNKNAQFSMKKTDSSVNACTFGISGSDTIDGASSLSNITQFNSYTVVSDGSVWWIL